ncbi:MAG TPA: hypothetical protein VMV18_15300, partial [bacterium]|nr:hypothetical protein [bacterium]
MTAPNAQDFIKRSQEYLLEEEPEEGGDAGAPWWKVIWLSGVDYFSTLGYQPGIAYLAAGAISPVATVLLVAVTLFAALPVYAEVAKHSYTGKGSIAMLERLLPGWFGKLFVLALLGFATTDFVITMTLSAADAAQHAVENPTLSLLLGGQQMLFTLLLLAALAGVFLRGFREAIGIALKIAVPYVLLNIVVLLAGLQELFWHPERIQDWNAALAARGSWPEIAIAAALIFPKLALGLSGFETGVSVMPQISNAGAEGAKDGPGRTGIFPAVRVSSTRKLLGASAGLMSVLLIASAFVTTTLIPAAAFADGGPANGRAIAYLAHQLLGDAFGGLYDFATIVILWFAGASAMAGLLNLIPRYLPRFGMAPRWVEKPRPLVVVFFLINVAVTLIFHANVDAQGGAYATGVLALMLSAAVAVALANWKTARARGWYFAVVSLIFAYVMAANVVQRPDGVIISSIFIALMLTFSGLSRAMRSQELRVEELVFVDEASRTNFEALRGKKVNLVPLKHLDQQTWKNTEIRRFFQVEGPLAFLHVEFSDDRSEFSARPRVKVTKKDNGDFLLEVHNAVAVANTIAFISEEIDPVSLFLTLTREAPMRQAFRYLLWGEGEIGTLVYEVLLRHWRATP